MKNLVFISLFFAAVALTSCGSNDPTPTPVQKIISKSWTIPIKGVGGSAITTPVTINLSDVSGVDASNFINGEFQNSGSNIQISGLKTGTVLSNFTMQVNTNAAVNFGLVTTTPGTNDFGAGVMQSGNRETTFLSSLFTAYTGKTKTAALKITFTPSVDIVAADNVNLVLTINGKYNWNTFPK